MFQFKSHLQRATADYINDLAHVTNDLHIKPRLHRQQATGHMQMSMRKRNPDADPHLYTIYFTILNK